MVKCAEAIVCTTSGPVCSLKETLAVAHVTERLIEILVAFKKLRLWWYSLG